MDSKNSTMPTTKPKPFKMHGTLLTHSFDNKRDKYTYIIGEGTFFL
ncbi:hypothetical protein A3Q56_08664 [Intoshia linei]|uniref:Uncharacterized protein n=1 Tax=Intoshia linei TaxID=1819745 RepID=A0A177AQE5_9BILA|nr:hypothetical protein A3Q56_08664 [Intoshia linei]